MAVIDRRFAVCAVVCAGIFLAIGNVTAQDKRRSLRPDTAVDPQTSLPTRMIQTVVAEPKMSAAAFDARVEAKGETLADLQQKVYRGGAVLVDTATPATMDLDLSKITPLRDAQPGDAPIVKPDRYLNRTPAHNKVPLNRVPHDIDPLLAGKVSGTSLPDERVFTAPNLSFNGQPHNATPPDTNGDVGEQYYMQVINGGGARFVIYNKSDGSVAAGAINMRTLAPANSRCNTNAAGDGIVMYDSLAKRWVMSEFTGPSPNSGGTPPWFLCVYVSQTSDPVTGGWYAYAFQRDTRFPDYPKYGVWNGAYTITSQEPSQERVFAIERSQMLIGEPSDLVDFPVPETYGFSPLTPADADGPFPPPAGSNPIFLRQRDDEFPAAAMNNELADFIQIWTLQLDWSDLANAAFVLNTSLPVSDFNLNLCGGSTNCAPQPGTAQGLDSLYEVIMWRVQHRNFGTHESLVFNHITDPRNTDQPGIRWYELQRQNGSAWSVRQEGTYSPDATSRFMGSIAMDRSGNLALGYTLSSNLVFPSVAYTGRRHTDNYGQMTQAETLLYVGGSSQTNSNRWGDYSSMSVDPVDDCTFWYTNQYRDVQNNRLTGIASFDFDACGDEPPGFCGDGVVGMGETCDDGNGASGDGCSNICKTELGFDCVTPAPVDTNRVADGGFETGGNNNTFWGESAPQSDFDVICTTDLCGSAGGAGPRTGDGFAWLGGEQDVFTIAQSVTIPTDAVNVRFYLNPLVCQGTTDSFSVRIDNTAIGSATVGQLNCNGQYQLFDQPIPAQFRDDGVHQLRFIGSTTSNNSAFLVDDVAIVGAIDQPSVCSARDICFAEDFDPGVAGDLASLGWQTITVAGSVLEWGTTDDGTCMSTTTPNSNLTDGFGEAACVDSDASGNLGTQTTLLCSPPINLSGSSGASLDFNYTFQVAVDSGEDVFAAVAGTTPPTPSVVVNDYADLLTVFGDVGTEFERGGDDVTLDLSAFDGEPQVWACFYYRSNFDWYAQVDDVAVTAQSCQMADDDGDGITNSLDNCINVANSDQRDTDSDGFGNICDADFNDDCIVNVQDLGLLRSTFFTGDPDTDMNGDGVVNVQDLGLLRTSFFAPPGPSGVDNICDAAEEGVQFFTDQTAWAAALGGNIETIPTTSAGVALADEVFVTPGPNELLCQVDGGTSERDCTLTWRSFNAGLCHDVQLRALQGITWNDQEGSPAFAVADALSIGDVDNGEDDDFIITAIGNELFEGIGFTLVNNDSNAGESILVLGEEGVVLGTIDSSQIPATTGSAFIGIVSDQPITRIIFDEDAGGDDIAISNLVFDNCE